MKHKTCKKCGKEFPANKKHFQKNSASADNLDYYCKDCKHEIQNFYRSTKPKYQHPNDYIRIKECKNCSEKFEITSTQENLKEYCSDKCRTEYRNKNKNNSKPIKAFDDVINEVRNNTFLNTKPIDILKDLIDLFYNDSSKYPIHFRYEAEIINEHQVKFKIDEETGISTLKQIVQYCNNKGFGYKLDVEQNKIVFKINSPKSYDKIVNEMNNKNDLPFG